jgi:hypothetical protein
VLRIQTNFDADPRPVYSIPVFLYLYLKTHCCGAVPFDTFPVPFQVPTSYFPAYGSDSGSLHNFKKMLKLKFLSLRFLLKVSETVREQIDFNLQLFILFSYSDSF